MYPCNTISKHQNPTETEVVQHITWKTTAKSVVASITLVRQLRKRLVNVVSLLLTPLTILKAHILEKSSYESPAIVFPMVLALLYIFS